jgi:hypothetical protein
MGTPHYMSPEQVRREKVDSRSDLFSLGAVFYELLSGHKPFDGDSMHTVLYHVMQDDPQPLRKWVDIPPMLVELVERALLKDRARRFQRAVHLGDAVRAVRTALDEGREGEATLDSEVGSPEATVLEPRLAPRSSVRGPGSRPPSVGAVALDPSRQPEPPNERTGRPTTTLSGRSSTQVDRARASLPQPRYGLYAGAALAVVLFAGGGFYLFRALSARSTVATEASDAGDRQIGALTEALVDNQVQLARKKLGDKSYAAAAAQAERAIKLDPESAEAKKVLEEARGALRDIEKAAADARAGIDAQDSAKASEALWRLLSADPTHAGAEELASALDKDFRGRAEDARRLMDASRGAAQQANAGGGEAFSEAARQAKEGETLFASAAYARAALRFLSARDGFERARGVSKR